MVHPRWKNKDKLLIVQQGVSIFREGRFEGKVAQGLALASVCRQILQESLALFYAVNTFVFKGFDTLMTFVNIVGERNARAIGSFEIDRFAVTRIPLDRAYQGNKATRTRIQTLQHFAEKYGWVSIKITGDCHQDGLHAGGSFKIINAGNEWENGNGWPCNSTYIQQNPFRSGICSELRASKERFEQLQ